MTWEDMILRVSQTSMVDRATSTKLLDTFIDVLASALLTEEKVDMRDDFGCFITRTHVQKLNENSPRTPAQPRLTVHFRPATPFEKRLKSSVGAQVEKPTR